MLGQPNLNVKVNREKAARYGLNAGDINNVVQAALGGTSATTLLEADRQFSVTVRLAPEYRSAIDSVRSIKVGYQTPSGANAYVPLSELADISLDTGASYIYHERNERFMPIKFSVRGRDLGSTVAEAQQRIAQNVKLPTGYRITWAGEFEELQQAKARLEIIVPISLLMILVLLYGLFNSLRDSLMALAGIPFAAGGGIMALYFSGLDFSISAAVGFVSLFGVSVMNGILIMTYYNEVRPRGMGTVEAMFHAAEQRMRPMLMTALSACIGLLPAAVSTGIGSQVQRPLATVVVGGMLIGPIIMLVVVPAVQTLFLGRDRPAPPAPRCRRMRRSRASNAMRTPRQSLRIALCASAIAADRRLGGVSGICRRGDRPVPTAATVRDQPRPPRRVAISRPRKERPERALKASPILRTAMTAKLTKAVRPTTANRRRKPAPRSKPEKIPAMPICTSSRCVVWTKRKTSPAGTTRRFRISKASAGGCRRCRRHPILFATQSELLSRRLHTWSRTTLPIHRLSVPRASCCDTGRPKHHCAIRQARDDQSPDCKPRYHAARGKPWRDQRDQRDKHRNVGPPRIGGPTASAAGINGTTIRAKH